MSDIIRRESAFPRNWKGYDNARVASYADPGMTLRDDFAAQALAGWLASFATDVSPKPKGVAEFAYQMADAMLAERSKGGA